MNIDIYCDGGCRKNDQKRNVGGWGVVLKCGDHVKELSGTLVNTTNNKMELIACLKALSLIKTVDIPIIVYSDSSYLTDGVRFFPAWKQRGWRTSSRKPIKNKKLWILLMNEVSRQEDIKFVRVKGHSGIKYNERADLLANYAMDNYPFSNYSTEGQEYFGEIKYGTVK